MLVGNSDKNGADLGNMFQAAPGKSMILPANARNTLKSGGGLNRSALLPGSGMKFNSASKLPKSPELPIKPPKNPKEVSLIQKLTLFCLEREL